MKRFWATGKAGSRQENVSQRDLTTRIERSGPESIGALNAQGSQSQLRRTGTVTSLYPELGAIHGKLHRSEGLTDEELKQFQRQLDALERRAERKDEPAEPDEPIIRGPSRETILGHATRAGTERLAGRFGANTCGFYRESQGLFISSLGIGTYHGAMTRNTDDNYADSIHAALRGGINLIDTSLSYRSQRSERAVARALRRFLECDEGRRDEVVICSKGGYLVPDAMREGTFDRDDVAGGCHCMAPGFLADQIERSRNNLEIGTIDVYYLHNPEEQLRWVSEAEFLNRIRRSFAQLEDAVEKGFIRSYGMATWDGFLGGGLSLSTLAGIASELAGDGHHFRFIQLPVNLSRQQARTIPTQQGSCVLDVAAELGITAIASATISQGRLASGLSARIARLLPELETDAARSIQFTRSTPGITAALVGMRQAAHVAENLRISRATPLDAASHARIEDALFGEAEQL